MLPDPKGNCQLKVGENLPRQKTSENNSVKL